MSYFRLVDENRFDALVIYSIVGLGKFQFYFYNDSLNQSLYEKNLQTIHAMRNLCIILHSASWRGENQI